MSLGWRPLRGGAALLHLVVLAWLGCASAAPVTVEVDNPQLLADQVARFGVTGLDTELVLAPPGPSDAPHILSLDNTSFVPFGSSEAFAYGHLGLTSRAPWPEAVVLDTRHRQNLTPTMQTATLHLSKFTMVSSTLRRDIGV
jgi:hypothetical protein